MNSDIDKPPPSSGRSHELKAEGPCAAGAPPPSPWASRLLPGCWQAVVLVVLLGVHLVIRLYHSHQLPLTLDTRHDYSRSYGYAMSLAMGHGFADVPAVGTPEAKPVDDFLAMRVPRISREELRAYAAAMPDPAQDPWVGIYSSLATTRVLDMYVTGILWRVFGVDWAVVYFFSAVVSTLTCLVVFRLGATLGGGFWPGLLAAAAFCFSPMEKFLTAWSIRDTSPLWFAAGAFAVFAWCTDPRASSVRSVAASCAVGVLVGIGTGWRMDPLLLMPYFLCAIPVGMLVAGKRFSIILASIACFACGIVGARGGIAALGSAERQPTQTGFHMAYYGEAVRTNMLGVENSAQVAWCDMQTLVAARRYDAAHEADGPLEYISARYGRVCRDMYLAMLRYNAYHWAAAFPRIWWQSLRGHPDDRANAVGWSDWRDSLLARGTPAGWPDMDARVIVRHCPALVSGVMCVGMLAAWLCGPRPIVAAALALFSVYFAAVTFVVMPMQKHMAMMLVPGCTFIGVAIWTMGCLLVSSARQALIVNLDRHRFRRVVGVGAAAVLLWGIVCGVCFAVSRTERQSAIRSLLALGESGEPAPETVKGDRVFHVGMPAASAADDVGYLITIRASDAPGSLVCRHRRVGTPDFRPTVLRTTHALLPGREQYFFVSCLQGRDFGDPRSYACTVTLEGDARIASVVQVDFSSWKGLPVSTVFTADDRSPGSPRTRGVVTQLETVGLPVSCRASGSRDPRFDAEGVMFGPPRRPERAAGTLAHLALRDTREGVVRYLVSDGEAFRDVYADAWRTDLDWRVLRGDVDGDGVTDILGRETASGGWWLTTTINGYPRSLPLGGGNSPGSRMAAVADLNGDRLDDVVSVSVTGDVWAGLADGRGVHMATWGTWPSDRPLSWMMAGDFDGDGREDLVAWDATRMTWVLFFARETQFEVRECPGMQGAVLVAAAVSDIDGDGGADLVAVSHEHLLHVGIWDGETLRFTTTKIPGGSAPALLTCGDFDGDGRAEPVIADSRDGSVWRGRHSDGTVTCEPAGKVGGVVRFVTSGDFAAAGREAIAAVTDTNEVLVGRFDGQRFVFESWLKRVPGEVAAEPIRIDSFSE